MLVFLAERPMTCAELARAVSVHRAVAHRHLASLRRQRLVARRPSPRLWQYYRITERGAALLERWGEG